MSKCREEFEKWFNEKNCIGSSNLVGAIWKAAWNARGKVDAEICEGLVIEKIRIDNEYRARRRAAAAIGKQMKERQNADD